MEPFRQRIVALIAQYIKFIITFIYLTESSRSFCLKHSRHRESVFPLNSKNDTLIVFHPYANWSRWRDRCKTCCGVGKWWSENHTYLFRALDSIKNIVYRNIYLNVHIFKWSIEKGTMLTSSTRIDKYPTLGQSFSDKSSSPGPTRWQLPDKCPGDGGGHAWNWLSIMRTRTLLNT